MLWSFVVIEHLISLNVLLLYGFRVYFGSNLFWSTILPKQSKRRKARKKSSLFSATRKRLTRKKTENDVKHTKNMH